jgi:hypothetical protein
MWATADVAIPIAYRAIKDVEISTDFSTHQSGEMVLFGGIFCTDA